MSSFFTLPASQRKRKRSQPVTKPAGESKRNATRDEDSVSGSDLSDDDVPTQSADAEYSEEEDDEFANEDPAAKRVRLAEQYLANTQKEVLEDGGFDAKDVDEENLRRRMGERLKVDTAESKGKLYRWIAEDLDWQRANRRTLRGHSSTKCVTGVALNGKFIYAVSKDLHLIKWELPGATQAETGRRQKKQPKVVACSRGNRKTKKNEQHHHAAILCVAVSPDGKFVATGGADRKLIIWDAASLKPLKVFMHHRDAVTALAFRRGTNQMYSVSKDRTVKIWSLDELAYVETLFGHQDEVVGVSALSEEKCVTVGARDRTARLWKVVEETNLAFRGGGAPGTSKALESLQRAYGDSVDNDSQAGKSHHEGSMDCVSMIDDDLFVTGSDNGSISLWNIHKKKAIFTMPLAHGLDPSPPPDEGSAEQDDDPSVDQQSRRGNKPQWVTALRAIPFSDVVLSGSWDGYIRAWKISQDKRRIESLGTVGANAQTVDELLAKEGLNPDSLSNGALEAMRAGAAEQQPIKGIINNISILDRGERGKDGLLVAAAIGKEHRFGRWTEAKEGRNCVVFLEVPLKIVEAVEVGADGGSGEDQNGTIDDEGDFEGFD